MTDIPITHAIRGFILAALLPLVVWCHGCATTPMERARTIVDVSAEAVAATDRIVTPRYAAALGAASTSPETLRRWSATVEALVLTRDALLTAEAALDAIEAGAEGDPARVVGCVVVALQRLLGALPEVGVELPEALVVVLSMAAPFGASCDPPSADIRPVFAGSL